MTFTTDDVDKAMALSVTLRGADFRYGTHYHGMPAELGNDGPGCRYSHEAAKDNSIHDEFTTNQPACIVGWVFVILGLDLPAENTSCDMSGVHKDLFTTKAVAFLKAAQVVQDENGTWGQAHSTAQETVRGFDENGDPLFPTHLIASQLYLDENARVALVHGDTAKLASH